MSIEIRKELQHSSIQDICQKYNMTFEELFQTLKPYNTYKKQDTGDYITRNHGRYLIRKQINGKQKKFGSFIDLDEAIQVRDNLIASDWKAEPSEYLGDMYISRADQKWIISKIINRKTIQYGRYETRGDARKVRNCLVKFNWDKEYLELICKQLGVDRVGS